VQFTWSPFNDDEPVAREGLVMTYNCHAFRKFFKNGDPITVDGVKAVYEYAEDDVLRIRFPDKRSLAYTDIEHVPELDAKLAQEAMQLEAMLESGAVLVKPEEWGSCHQRRGRCGWS
jgi:hypothetical protein